MFLDTRAAVTGATERESTHDVSVGQAEKGPRKEGRKVDVHAWQELFENAVNNFVEIMVVKPP